MSADSDRRSVVVGVDGSPESLHAVHWAATEAARRRAPLRLVAAFDQPGERLTGLLSVGSQYRDILLHRARSNLAAAAAAPTALEPDVAVDPAFVVGYPVEVLVAESRHAQLVVVGDRGLGRIASVISGSVAVGLATHAECPVVVVREAPLATADPAPVVVGLGGWAVSEAVLEFAFEAASVRRAPLFAVLTWGNPPGDVRAGGFWDFVADDAKAQLAELLAGWNEKYPDVHVERIVSHSVPARQLLVLSVKAQLVVVGSRGHGELAGMLLGSVANVLVHRAACPVAVVRSIRRSE